MYYDFVGRRTCFYCINEQFETAVMPTGVLEAGRQNTRLLSKLPRVSAFSDTAYSLVQRSLEERTVTSIGYYGSTDNSNNRSTPYQP